jgi:NADH:ubiquinone oxidoreductase subunit 5 (subunit L)/multisubunit Na+/H+ antiporter MnhA subunit
VGEALQYVLLWGGMIGLPLAAGFTRIKLRWISATGVGLALVLAAAVIVDVATGDETDFYDIGREGALILGLVLTGVALGLWLLSALIGRTIRRGVCRSRSRRSPS